MISTLYANKIKGFSLEKGISGLLSWTLLKLVFIDNLPGFNLFIIFPEP